MRIRLILSILLPFAVVLSSCSDRPKGVLGESDMVDLIADIETAEAYTQTQSGPSHDETARQQITNFILDKHGITKEEFDSTMTWYGRNIDEYQKLFEKVDKILAVRQQKATGSNDDVRISDLWPYSRHLLIDDNSASDNVIFSIPAGDLEKGSMLNWKMRLRNSSGGDALLGVDYDNGSTAYISQSVMGNRQIDMTIQTDTGKIVRRIYGYFHINSDMEKPMWIDSISLTSQPYDSTKYYQISRLRNYNGPHRKHLETKTDSTESKSDSICVTTSGSQSREPVGHAHPMAKPKLKPFPKPANPPVLKKMPVKISKAK